MQTNFSLAQLADAATAESEAILRKCVHCGFCTATCPTFQMLGDELDSPRGRIYLIKDMLENDRPADPRTIKHIDRCLSCLSCMTTCPSGVNYMHLVDHARTYIEQTAKRPLADRWLRRILAMILPYPARFRASLMAAFWAKPLAPVLKRFGPHGRRLSALLELAPAKAPARALHAAPGTYPPPQPAGEAEAPARRGRVALLSGCAQSVLGANINDATIRLLNRAGIEVVLPRGEGCCGALVHHMGREHDAMDAARANVDAWWAEMQGEGLDAIVITASGCGTTIKDYGFLLREDKAYAEKAKAVAALAKDVTEYLTGLAPEILPAPVPASAQGGVSPASLKVAYHSACSMQHGQKIKQEPKTLLTNAGFSVHDVPEGHMCCGSAGTYNILQPELATRLKERKLANIAQVSPDIIATGNIGCMTQLASGADIPVIHTAELLDWATGGPVPEGVR
ncbi:glycolate oxidase subunit GlcF [Breoghania sp.]|uniref:glycolate oxidase subunit GlcF n=1 Tax=Breoghania sp. TaxID=2065378 RepID=UPI0029CA11B7|nr:glycolate oxidase subunit GlcF [Breoghania sp.]